MHITALCCAAMAVREAPVYKGAVMCPVRCAFKGAGGR